jgi:hypothetical protein
VALGASTGMPHDAQKRADAGSAVSHLTHAARTGIRGLSHVQAEPRSSPERRTPGRLYSTLP